MKASAFLIIPLLIFMLIVDLYTYRGLKPLINKFQNLLIRKVLKIFYWSISIIMFAAFVLFFLRIEYVQKAETYVYVGYLTAGFALFYVPKFVLVFFVLLRDVQKAVSWLIGLFTMMEKENKLESKSKRKMERSEFLYQMGLMLAAIPFASILYGVTKGKFNFRIMQESLHFPNLPKAFRGLRIVQISDMHLGSFNKNYEKIEKAIELINEQKPDIILFTGDLVNNFAEETEGWAPVLSKMNAKMGKYSILGNHDYGDYSHWPSAKAKADNLKKIKDFHQNIGFKLLLNETERLKIDEDEIALIGVENWGKPPFPQHGDLDLAMNGNEDLAFKLLMSHDPSHWDAKVLDTDVDLTFAGHTHGMQFGIERAGIKWSPVQYKYPRWGGLYNVGKQFLYVNRGFGYIGFPGRIGMPPEITLIELS
ncbi:metallophosphoesterase [Ancylomarina sp. 16SWW S1-10-2]|uniref:metallophosphoesterase n=1 Tax=Ancylomarina sp. 16SWW S1-10-2 TaxID=2499681 RepID=UPI0012AD5059|nr:metallophosphoesterase [Ancylomarina sp. 16SWW S1-10-2]MRT92697.1 metallophosphoesterase [Ancylomarina sp. 16SWW S1-10-2]